jgi:hypothetical protein
VSKLARNDLIILRSYPSARSEAILYEAFCLWATVSGAAIEVLAMTVSCNCLPAETRQRIGIFSYSPLAAISLIYESLWSPLHHGFIRRQPTCRLGPRYAIRNKQTPSHRRKRRETQASQPRSSFASARHPWMEQKSPMQDLAAWELLLPVVLECRPACAELGDLWPSPGQICCMACPVTHIYMYM